jgi:signal transduction histidine kinase
MAPRTGNEMTTGRTRSRPAIGSTALIEKILRSANKGIPAHDFLCETSHWILGHAGCDSIEIRIVERGRLVCCEANMDDDAPTRQEAGARLHSDGERVIPCYDIDSDLERVCEEIVLRRYDPSLPFFTQYGSFSIGNGGQPFDLGSESCKWAGGRTVRIGGTFKSILIVPFKTEESDSALILFKAKGEDFFDAGQVSFYEYLAQILGMASTQRRAQIALRERIKELTCLYGIARVAKKPSKLGALLNDCVGLLPPAWLHVDVASARIEIDGRSYATDGFRHAVSTQTAPIIVRGSARGTVTVAYSEKRPDLDEGPFLREERSLLDAVAREIAVLIENRETSEAQLRLQEQVRHADRLATIGQLAAGVAHELNEPLAAILGLAQLDSRMPDLPEQASKDSNNIVSAALHAREIIAKLKLFARQTPPHRGQTEINRIVNEGLHFLEARCANARIHLVKELAADLPEIHADGGQLHQVVVNLAVNAIQAMPQGGRLLISTMRQDDGVELRVEDSGAGMDHDTLKHIYDPFFTTKSPEEGTGLGLSIVHGIVESHGGTIAVESTPGRGTCFEVRLPLRGDRRNRRETDDD